MRLFVRGFNFAAFDQRLEPILLPRVSTTRLGEPGLLWASATAILALYDVTSSCTLILAAVIPDCLISYDLGGGCCDRFVGNNGAFIECLRQLVSSVRRRGAQRHHSKSPFHQ